MTAIVPNIPILNRLVPAAILESAALLVCVLLYIYTENLLWILAAAVVGLIFGVWIVVMLFRHRAEWRWHDGTPGAKG